MSPSKTYSAGLPETPVRPDRADGPEGCRPGYEKSRCVRTGPVSIPRNGGRAGAAAAGGRLAHASLPDAEVGFRVGARANALEIDPFRKGRMRLQTLSRPTEKFVLGAWGRNARRADFRPPERRVLRFRKVRIPTTIRREATVLRFGREDPLRRESAFPFPPTRDHPFRSIPGSRRASFRSARTLRAGCARAPTSSCSGRRFRTAPLPRRRR